MARLSADLIRRSPQFLSSIKERVLDLRGNKIAILDNLGATEDQFDTIDLSDNQIVKLENFPFMNRLGTLLINNNRITLINPNLGDFLPKMHTLVLTNNRLTSLAEIDPLTSFRNLQFLSLLGNTVTKQPDYRLYVINKLKHLHLLDLQKVKQQERTEAVQKFHSKEAEEATKKVAAKSYTPIVMDAQGTTKNQGPKVVAPTPAQITAIKERAEAAQKFHSNEAEEVANKVVAKAHTPVVMDAQGTAQDQGPKVVIPTPVQITDTKILKDEETREKYDYAVAHPEEASSTGQVTSEFALPKPDTNMAEASEETEAEEMETDGQDQEDGAEEQKQTDESTQIQEAFCAVQIHTEYVIRETNKMETDWEEQNDGADEQKQNEESRLNTSIVEEMLGVGLDSTSTDICHIESYLYKNFERAPFNFIFSWRKRPFRGLHIIPSPRRQESGDCAYHATLCIMECSFKVKYARRGRRKNREFNVRLSHDHLKMLVLDFMASEDGKGFRPRDKLRVCLMVAMKYGVVSEKDFKDGCPPGAVRYKIRYYRELPDDEKEGIPDLLDKAKMVLTSFRVTPQYRSLRPHDIYRYLPAEDVVYQESISSSGGSDDKKPMHESHCVVLTNHGLAYPTLEEVATEAEVSMPERYFEYLNSYSAGYGVDGSGYIYSDSIHKCYTVVV